MLPPTTTAPSLMGDCRRTSGLHAHPCENEFRPAFCRFTLSWVGAVVCVADRHFRGERLHTLYLCCVLRAVRSTPVSHIFVSSLNLSRRIRLPREYIYSSEAGVVVIHFLFLISC